MHDEIVRKSPASRNRRNALTQEKVWRRLRFSQIDKQRNNDWHGAGRVPAAQNCVPRLFTRSMSSTSATKEI